MAWKDRLQDASFRGVPFKVEGEGAPVGGALKLTNTRTAKNPIPRISARSPSGQISPPMLSAMIVSISVTD